MLDERYRVSFGRGITLQPERTIFENREREYSLVLAQTMISC
jgi:hypothetical protein